MDKLNNKEHGAITPILHHHRIKCHQYYIILHYITSASNNASNIHMKLYSANSKNHLAGDSIMIGIIENHRRVLLES